MSTEDITFLSSLTVDGVRLHQLLNRIKEIDWVGHGRHWPIQSLFITLKDNHDLLDYEEHALARALHAENIRVIHCPDTPTGVLQTVIILSGIPGELRRRIEELGRNE